MKDGIPLSREGDEEEKWLNDALSISIASYQVAYIFGGCVIQMGMAVGVYTFTAKNTAAFEMLLCSWLCCGPVFPTLIIWLIYQ